MPENDFKHWYLVAFSIPAPGHVFMASVIAGFDVMNITVPLLAELRHTNQIQATAAVVGISYMGYMTRETMQGPVPQ
jgi:hypothetical protein